MANKSEMQFYAASQIIYWFDNFPNGFFFSGSQVRQLDQKEYT